LGILLDRFCLVSLGILRVTADQLKLTSIVAVGAVSFFGVIFLPGILLDRFCLLSLGILRCYCGPVEANVDRCRRGSQFLRSDLFAALVGAPLVGFLTMVLYVDLLGVLQLAGRSINGGKLVRGDRQSSDIGQS
jgi:hypothetical protein